MPALTSHCTFLWCLVGTAGGPATLHAPMKRAAHVACLSLVEQLSVSLELSLLHPPVPGTALVDSFGLDLRGFENFGRSSYVTQWIARNHWFVVYRHAVQL